MKAKIISACLVLAALAFLMVPTFALAQTGPVPAPQPTCKPKLFSGGTGEYLSFGVTADGVYVYGRRPKR